MPLAARKAGATETSGDREDGNRMIRPNLSLNLSKASRDATISNSNSADKRKNSAELRNNNSGKHRNSNEDKLKDNNSRLTDNDKTSKEANNAVSGSSNDNRSSNDDLTRRNNKDARPTRIVGILNSSGNKTRF